MRACNKIGIQVETKNKRWPNRKHPRLKHYDYDSTGAYFITICTQNRECMLSRVVGRGLAPAVTSELEYTLWGEIAERQLLLLENRYSHLTIDRYVIMPNHIHMIAVLRYEAAGASPRPTIMDVICAYKSLTTRECRKNGLEKRLFQTSFLIILFAIDRIMKIMCGILRKTLRNGVRMICFLVIEYLPIPRR